MFGFFVTDNKPHPVDMPYGQPCPVAGKTRCVEVGLIVQGALSDDAE